MLMRKIIFLLLILISFLSFYFVTGPKKSENYEEHSSVLSIEEPTNEQNRVDLSHDGQALIVYYLKTENPGSLELINNLDEKLDAKNAKDIHSCSSLVNAGFYNENNEFVGLFLTEGEVLSNYRKNTLFDGVFSINYLDTPRITRIQPKDSLRLAVQTGPILVENSYAVPLKIKNDHKARRVIAAIDGLNELYFLVIYQKDSFFSGPELAKLPEIIKLIEQKTDVNFADAINLDGGTASTFFHEDEISLNELSLVGAFFCLR